MSASRGFRTSWVLLLALVGIGGFLFRPTHAEPTEAAPVAGVDYIDGRVLVKFAPGAPAAVRSRAHAAAGGKVITTIPGIGVSVVEVGPGRTLDAIAVYAKNPNVAFAEVDGIARATVDCSSGGGTFSSDACSWRQWGLHNTGQVYREGTAAGTADADVDVPEAWATGAQGNGIIIAVLDTGYDLTHEDLASKVEAWAGFTGDGVADLHGHGTWTASIAAGITGNGAGIAGTAPGARLIVGKVLDNSGSGSWSEVAAGIRWAADYAPGTPKVISMSLGGRCRGGPFSCSTLQDAVNYADSKGALLIAAAGNSGGSTEHPGAYANVLAVAATDANNTVASFSSVGNVAAPGVDIIGAFPDCAGGDASTTLGKACGYDYGNGTSASTPIAAGVAALVWSNHTGHSSAGVRSALVEGATDIPGTSYDGAGRINACAALNAAGTPCDPGASDPGEDDTPTPEPTDTPTPEPTETPTPTPVDGTVVALAGSSVSTGSTWTAVVRVSVTVDGSPAAGIVVAGAWSGGVTGPGRCTTETDGTCTIERTGIHKRVGGVTFTVNEVGGQAVAGPTTVVAKP